MPAVVAKGAVIVISVAVAAAIAVYESPQARHFAEDVRRRIAVALRSLGEDINPDSQQPRFNRSEDAEGFMQSGGDMDVDADEETKRRQREELMYWNALRLEKKEREKKESEGRPSARSRGSSFDDFLREDPTAEKGTYVYNTGADVHQGTGDGLSRRRGEGVRGLDRSSLYVNPFADEHNIDLEEQQAMDAKLMSPEASEKFETMSDDLYGASEDPRSSRESTATLAGQLIDTSDEPVPDPPVSHPTMEILMQENMDRTNLAHSEDALAAIHAWADNNASSSLHSPLPATPSRAAPDHQQTPASPVFDDPPISLPGSGEATPTDSISLAGSGEEVWLPRSGATSDADVMSVEGISTPGSWTEVGSVVSENDVVMQHS